MLLEKLFEQRNNRWKNKARIRGREKNALLKKIKRLIKSRLSWKERAKKYKQQLTQAEKTIKLLEDELKKND